ncbi:MAG: helix-turn-helix domain-containing protein [Verrucomicrobia bacterium]|nr:helix-turn-helix domain-containing protein [Verrucomicrobiota bacterium]
MDPTKEVLPYGLIASDAPDPMLANEVPVSHIGINCEQIGWRATQRMHHALLGIEALGTETELIPPLGVVQGCSTITQKRADIVVQRARLKMAQMSVAELSATAVAYELQMNRKTLYEHFVRSTGQSLADEIKCIKFTEAKRLLLETKMNVADIALRLGYAKESAFIHAFRLHIGKLQDAFADPDTSVTTN